MSELFWVNLFHQFAVGLSVGSSTFALVFYYYVVAAGETLPEQRKFMHIVYFVLRIGMMLIVLSEFAIFLYSYHINNYLYWMANPEVLMRLTLFTVIVINALLMHKRLISMWIGPVIAGGSWYAFFFFSVFVDIRWVELGFNYVTLLSGYLLWLLLLGIFLSALRLYLTRAQRLNEA
ncbi:MULTISPECIES: hypothetical protein [Thiomicrorhabdus]|uniref:Uncharacterized protein n=1 Tax=Thiomicrorhabdus heinhorstiae TaxID=2748010 RepID=A0ABS0BZ72_9GAMM|nr:MULTISPECIES: hypothetical protein [Thiomicrorhabdus]MBF6057377.1 hypothetical protein [Thiomicrorhabdus heinhorstiae]